MARSKYINTFNTTAEYDAYIESAYPKFPNVGYDKEAGNISIVRTSPNNHLIYMEIEDASLTMTFSFTYNGGHYSTITFTNDTLNNTCYTDDYGTHKANTFGATFSNRSNILAIKKFNFKDENINITMVNGAFLEMTKVKSIDLSTIDLSKTTSIQSMFKSCNTLKTIDLSNTNISSLCTNTYETFRGCNNLTTINLNNCDFSDVSNISNRFRDCYALTDVYVNIEGTLNNITNNLSSSGNAYVPSSATIHYDNGIQVIDYKWQNNAWTPQS